MQVIEQVNSKARTQTHCSGLLAIITRSCPCRPQRAAGLMFAGRRASGTEGAVSRLWAKRGFSPSLSQECLGASDAAGGRDLWGAAGKSMSAALQEASSIDRETSRRTKGYLLDSVSDRVEKPLVPLHKGLMPLKPGCRHFNKS